MNLKNVILIQKKKNRRIIIFGHYLFKNGGFDESNHNTKKSESSRENGLLEMLVCKISLKFRSVVFEILMKMCFDFSISKAHSSVAKPKSNFFIPATYITSGSSMLLQSLMQFFCNTLYIDKSSRILL